MTVRIITGDCREVLRTLEDESVHCVVTSPPYFGLRDYGVAGQIGLEPSPEAFVAEIVDVFEEVWRVLRNDGTCWVNLGDSYATQGGPGWQGKNGQRSDRRFTGTRNTVPMREQARTAFKGLKPKDMIGIPWRVAFALQSAGWWLRQDIIWAKPNPMPESVTDRCTKAHEYLFLLAKSERYHFDQDAILEPASPNTHAQPAGRGIKNNESFASAVALPVSERNKRSVWTVTTQPFSEAHFATFPPALIEPCIMAGCPKGGTVLDPFGGAGTTGLVADRLGRDAILIELNPEYAAMARKRIHGDCPMFTEVA